MHTVNRGRPSNISSTFRSIFFTPFSPPRFLTVASRITSPSLRFMCISVHLRLCALHYKIGHCDRETNSVAGLGWPRLLVVGAAQKPDPEEGIRQGLSRRRTPSLPGRTCIAAFDVGFSRPPELQHGWPYSCCSLSTCIACHRCRQSVVRLLMPQLKNLKLVGCILRAWYPTRS